jgi:hypothetical protein
MVSIFQTQSQKGHGEMQMTGGQNHTRSQEHHPDDCCKGIGTRTGLALEVTVDELFRSLTVVTGCVASV